MWGMCAEQRNYPWVKFAYADCGLAEPLSHHLWAGADGIALLSHWAAVDTSSCGSLRPVAALPAVVLSVPSSYQPQCFSPGAIGKVMGWRLRAALKVSVRATTLVLQQVSKACFALIKFDLLNENANRIRAIMSLRWVLNDFLACPCRSFRAVLNFTDQ